MGANVLKYRIKTASKSGFEVGLGANVVELAGRERSWRIRVAQPYPTPKLGISARHAVSDISGCGGGAAHPIVTPRSWHYFFRARGAVHQNKRFYFDWSWMVRAVRPACPGPVALISLGACGPIVVNLERFWCRTRAPRSIARGALGGCGPIVVDSERFWCNTGAPRSVAFLALGPCG